MELPFGAKMIEDLRRMVALLTGALLARPDAQAESRGRNEHRGGSVRMAAGYPFRLPTLTGLIMTLFGTMPGSSEAWLECMKAFLNAGLVRISP